MALVATQLFDLKPKERRRHERLKLTLPGRYMLSDHHEHPCSTINVSPVGIAVSGQQKGLIGERIILYINQIGRLEGVIARNSDTWFAVKLQLSPSKCEQLKETLAWLVSHHTHGWPDKRLHQRVMPFRRQATLTTPDGRQYRAALIDLSIRGAALSVDAAPPIGSLVTIGRTSARVIRHFAMGIAVEFDEPLPAGAFDVDGQL
ncbi:MAG: PilZ domain-containing protein [Roseiarcus sp.]|jgi:hypothetical protein